jgi:hypothetical protein
MSGLGTEGSSGGLPALGIGFSTNAESLRNNANNNGGKSDAAMELLPHNLYSSASNVESAAMVVRSLKDEPPLAVARVQCQDEQQHHHHHTALLPPAPEGTGGSSADAPGGSNDSASSQADPCGACNGRHRRHKCGRERVDVDGNFKDDNCSACVGKHRPHTCVKGKPEHLRQRKKKKTSTRWASSCVPVYAGFLTDCLRNVFFLRSSAIYVFCFGTSSGNDNVLFAHFKLLSSHELKISHTDPWGPVLILFFF